MAMWLEFLISLLIVVSGIFILVGSLGLLKLPTLMTRLHAPTKATTLGVGGALLASVAFFLGGERTLSVHELLVTGFLFLTAPVTAHFIAKTYLHLYPEERKTLPVLPEPQQGWSTYVASRSPRADEQQDSPHE
ncbi:Na+/H+ antiporter subunit G [Ectothiorhodospira marina]|uniref:Multicomponent K+:H+ antiporter subunit G n=1 Tax=Ectothiorhodospira marina TaxID=1396821 RepID=A0A1H7HRD4_9GAMM|nr:Na+/H+ antiporter subunit G [Ectothiorhodospira marina]SEK50755.1 multicomponent K+:H+ antiporter subunit G [Ectothiorhodospira marina]